MIPLRIKAEASKDAPPFVVRVRATRGNEDEWTEDDALLESAQEGILQYATAQGPLRLFDSAASDLDGDVLLVVPARGIAHRLIRAGSSDNSLLVTERCDQLCVMCSQPPKAHHVDLFPLLERAAAIAPNGATIGLTGGEPTLFKEELFRFLDSTLAVRPDLRFHILTNAQHFDWTDADRLRRLAGSTLWGVPLYAPFANLHDATVDKQGAFDRLLQSLNILGRCGVAVELRTVLMATNAEVLPALARFILAHTPFVAFWAIMQLENIGYGRKNWNRLFFDNSESFTPVAAAIDIAAARGMDVALYNFPLCTVPAAYRRHNVASISDWKRRYLEACDACMLRESCGGFFEWYPEKNGFARIGLS